MITKDILRIALFVLFAAFALRSAFRIRGSIRVNKLAETEDTEMQQLLQRLQNNHDGIKQEPNGYENKNALKEVKDLSSNGYFSAGAIMMLIFLLLILM